MALPSDNIRPQLFPLSTIVDNPYQPRLDYDQERIAAIAASIEQHGLLQAPIGRQRADGQVELAFGHSRRRAFDLLAQKNPTKWGTMPVILRDLDDQAMALQAWIENRDRKDLTAYEEAKAIERNIKEFGWTQKQAAAKMQLDQSTIANKLRLLRLPEATLAQLQKGEISERQAMALLSLMELPEAARKAGLNIWVSELGSYITSVDHFLSLAAKFDSAALRRMVENILDRLTIPLVNQPWRNEPLEGNGIQAATCKECPIRLKHADRCPDRTCLDLKAAAYSVRNAKEAAASVGLPPLPKLAYNAYDSLTEVSIETITAKASERKCSNLGVMYNERGWGQKVPGHTDCYIVCGHGQGKRCACKMALARSGNPEASREARKRHDQQRIKTELIAPAERTIREALAKPTAQTWRALLTYADPPRASKLPKNADLAVVQHALAEWLTARGVDAWLEWADYSAAQRGLDSLFANLGMPSPWAQPDHLRANTAEPETVLQDDSGPKLGSLPWIVRQIGIIEAAITQGQGHIRMYAELETLGEELEDLAEQLDDATYEALAKRIDDALDALPADVEAP